MRKLKHDVTTELLVLPADEPWKVAHNTALLWSGEPIAAMLSSWLAYRQQYLSRYESKIGDDGVLGDGWAAIGKGLLGLLNGECGGLNCGTLSGIIHEVLSSEGLDPDNF